MNSQKPTIIIDTREKNPWDFESDDAFFEVIYKKLDAGDYSIEGLQDKVTIERKASVDELFANFSSKPNRNRVFAEFERLKDHSHKFFIIEESCDDVFNPEKYYVNKKKINKSNPMVPVVTVAHNLTELMLKHNAVVIFAGNKGRSLARGILLRAWKLHQNEGFFDKKNERLSMEEDME
jgi:ERCC4-type nuclease